MKTLLLLTTAPLLIALAGSVHAQNNCSCGAGTRVAPADDIATLLGGNTVCAAVGDSERWQEYHEGTTNAGGALTDYKKGPDDKVDPSKVVGSWSTAGTGTDSRVIYDYGSIATTYEYEVCHQSGGTILFCGAQYGGRNITASLRLGPIPVSCGFLD